jgi:hypothetical protein
LKVESLRPLIESGRRVWVWPDKDGVEKWREKVNHLLSDRFSIYVGFFDRYWIEADGKKADIADIQLRLLCHPETDRQAKADYELRNKQKSEQQPECPEGVDPELWAEHLLTIKALKEWQQMNLNDIDAPFIDPEELRDPRLHQWRETLRQRYKSKKSRQ